MTVRAVALRWYVSLSALVCPQALHTRDELSEKLQEVEEELAAVIKELQSQQYGIKAANKQMSEVSRMGLSPCE